VNLYTAGIATLVSMALAGELSRENLWLAVQGAKKYREAIRDGDVCDDAESASRCGVCENCPSMTGRAIAIGGVTALYCGEPLVEGESTCGCLVALRVDGKVTAAGKTRVGDEACPQKRWGIRYA